MNRWIGLVVVVAVVAVGYTYFSGEASDDLDAAARSKANLSVAVDNIVASSGLVRFSVGVTKTGSTPVESAHVVMSLAEGMSLDKTTSSSNCREQASVVTCTGLSFASTDKLGVQIGLKTLEFCGASPDMQVMVETSATEPTKDNNVAGLGWNVSCD